jgi:hypothetical protein
MTGPEVVYRSTHPDVLATLASYRDAMDAWHVKASALLTEFGFEGGHFLVVSGLGSRWISGVEYVPGEEPPPGWRVAERDGDKVLLPDKRRGAGKLAAQLVEECQPPADVRSNLPGMPGLQMVPGAVLTPALREMAGAVWVIWRSEPSKVDPEVWERIPLSQYWATREAADAEGGAA